MIRPNLGTTASREPGSLPHFGRAVTLTSVSTFVAMLAYAGPLGNAPTLTRSLGASPAETTWILSSMSVGLAVTLLTVGALADDYGRRRVFTTGAWVFAAGSALSAAATGPTLLVLGRLVEGAGAAGMVATGLGLVAAATAHASHQVAAASWWGASLGAGIAVGPVLTGLLDLLEWWRVFYWLLAASGAAIALAGARLFTETPANSSRRIDLLGAGLMTSGIGLLLVALVEARQGRVGLTASCGVVAAASLAAFAVSQIRGRHPMLEPALFRRPDFVAATMAALATGAGVIALMSFAGTFLVTGMGLTTLGAGALLGLWSGTSAVSAVLARRLPQRLAGHPQLVLGLVGVGIGMLLLTGIDTGSSPWRLVPGLVVAGLASGVLNAGLARQAVASVPPDRAALGAGINNTARYVGSSIGVTLVSVLATAPRGHTAALVSGWNQVAVLTATVSLAGAGAVAASARPRTRRSHDREVPR